MFSLIHFIIEHETKNLNEKVKIHICSLLNVANYKFEHREKESLYKWEVLPDVQSYSSAYRI
jgi:hypothetical protein